MESVVSKTKFKTRVLEYFREVKRTGRTLIVTDRGRPIVKIEPIHADSDSLRDLNGSVVRYEAPLEPVWGP